VPEDPEDRRRRAREIIGDADAALERLRNRNAARPQQPGAN
jgi:hypothetical protein